MSDQPGDRSAPVARPGPPRRRRVRLVLLVAAAAVAVLFLIVLLAPLLIGPLVRGRAERAIDDAVAGTATVGRASLSWFGNQEIGPVTITDDSGAPVAKVTLELRRGLWGLARAGLGMGPMNVGEAHVSGAATIVRRADGSTNVQDVLGPRQPSPPKPTTQGEPVRIPRGLTGALVIDDLDVRIVDQAAQNAGSPAAVTRIPDLAGRATITDATTASLDLAGDLFYGPGPDAATRPGGRAAITAAADSLTDASGRLTPDAIKIEAKADASNIAVVIADALAGMDSRLVSGLGERLQASVRASGTMANAQATLTASSPGLSADVALQSQDGVLTAPTPGTVRIAGEAVPHLVPGLQQSLEQGEVRFDALPEVRLGLERLRVRLPTGGSGGAPMDLAGSSLALVVETTETSGRVRVPSAGGGARVGGEGGGEGQELQPFRIAPASLRLESPDLTQEITLKGGASATLSGRSAGTLNVDLAAVRPLSATGEVQPGLPGRIRGTATLDGVATAIAQPFVGGAGLELADDVGPTLGIALRAQPGDPGEPAQAASPPAATRLTLDIESANVTGQARLVMSGSALRTEGDGIALRIGSVGPLATRLLAGAGVTVQSGGPVTVVATGVAVDLDRLNREAPAAGPDLRALAGQVRVETGPFSGRLAIPGEPERSWGMSPLQATIDAADLSQRLTMRAGTSFTLDNAPAGNINADLALSNILDSAGARAQALPALNGRVAISGIATAIAQPWVRGAGLDLPAGVGPKMDIVLAAASRGGQAGAGRVPATDLDVSIRSAGVAGNVAAVLDGRTIRRRGTTELTVRSPGTLAGDAAEAAGVVLSGGGYLKAVAGDYTVRFDESWKPLPGQSLADVELTMGGFSLRPASRIPAAPQNAPAQAPAAPVSLNQMTIAASLAPDRAPSATIRGSGAQGQAAFLVEGAMDLPGLFDPAGNLTPAAVRPIGSLEISNLPTTLAALVAPPPAPAPVAPGAAPRRPGLTVNRLIQDVVGPTVSVTLSAPPPQGGDAKSRDIALQLRSQRLSGHAAATITDTAMAVRGMDFRGTVSPELAATVIDAAGPGLSSRPTLAGPAQMTLTMSPVTIPLAGAAPDFKGAGDATLKVGLEGRTTINNVVLAGGEGQQPRAGRDIGPIGLENILLTASVPLGSLAEGGPAKPAEARLSGLILGPDGRRVAEMAGSAMAPLADGGPAGNLEAALRLNVHNSAWIDTFLGRPGLVAGAVGPTADVEAAATVPFAAPAGTGAQTPADSFDFERIAVTASVASPRLATTQALRATVTPGAASIDAPMVLRWTVDPEWANTVLLAPEPGRPQNLRLSGPTALNLALTRLTLARAPGQGPLAPGVFAADAEVTFPEATLVVGEGQRGVPTRLSRFRARISGGRDPGALGFSLTIDDAGGGPAQGGGPAVTMAGGLYNVADASGNLQADKAVLTANGAAASIPTILIDVLANQNGLIVEALGPTASVQAKAQGLTRSSGRLELTAVSPRAEAQVAGSIAGGVMTLPGTQPIATFKVVTPELGAMLVRGLPQLATVEKRPEDGPAVVRATDLTVPTDGDLRKLNGTIVLDFAQARFRTSSVFGQLLELAGQQTAATVGRRLEPITLRAANGVVSYDRVNIPLGEFTIATSGSVDLAAKRLDVLTFIPFGALTDEAAGLFNTDLGKVLGGALPTIEQATMVPFRTTGSFAEPETRPDMELFAREFGRSLLRPDQIIGGGLEDLLKKIGGDRNKRP